MALRRLDLRGFSGAALVAIEAHAWPGNVRALENALERGVLLARGPFVEADDVFGRLGKSLQRPMPVIAAPRQEEKTPLSIDVQAELRALLPQVPVQRTHVMLAQANQLLEIIDAAPPTTPSTSVTTTAETDGLVRRGSDPRFPRVLPDAGMDLFNAIDSYQNNLIKQALARTAGNRNRAAQLLGLNRTTLVEMIRRRGL